MVSRDDNTFLGLEFVHIFIPQALRLFLLWASLALTALWVFSAFWSFKRKEITLYYFIYVLGHFSIYYVSYVLIDDLSIGWLCINIWHNIQYIGIVWLFNKNKFHSGIDKEHLLISYLSQPHRFIVYLMFFLALTFVFYTSVNELIGRFSTNLDGLPLVLIVYSTLNMHHYIVDSRIWKLRKKSVRAHL